MMFLPLVFSTATAMKAAMKPATWPQQFTFSYEGKIQSGANCPPDFDYTLIGGDEKGACLTILKGSFVREIGYTAYDKPYVQYACDNPTKITMDHQIGQDENTKWILRPVRKGCAKCKPDSDYDLLNTHWEIILSNKKKLTDDAQVVDNWTIIPDMIHVLGAGDDTIITYPYWRADVKMAHSVQNAVNIVNNLQNHRTQLAKLETQLATELTPKHFSPEEVAEMHKKAEDEHFRAGSCRLKSFKYIPGFHAFCKVKKSIQSEKKRIEVLHKMQKYSKTKEDGPRYCRQALRYTTDGKTCYGPELLEQYKITNRNLLG